MKVWSNRIIYWYVLHSYRVAILHYCDRYFLILKCFLLPPIEERKYWYNFVNRWLILETFYLRGFWVSCNLLSQKCFKVARSRWLAQSLHPHQNGQDLVSSGFCEDKSQVCRAYNILYPSKALNLITRNSGSSVKFKKSPKNKKQNLPSTPSIF